MFIIEFIGLPKVDAVSHSSTGRIVAGDLCETFDASMVEWDEAAYKSSWCHELDRLAKGADKAVLLTVAMNPADSNWLRGYVLYRFDMEVRIQERIFIVDELRGGFDLSNPSSGVGSYESVDEDGTSISEWKVSMRDIEKFRASECK